ncbi:PAS domain-containing sensor histidine kinase [Sporocytophaga myxococcoides]|nr:PAS domain-containing sensor histidine kinase [Sporocytophaga myxococcoides]
MADYLLDDFFYLAEECMCITSGDGYFKKVNPAFAKMLGYSEEEICTMHFSCFIYPDDLKITSKIYKSFGQETFHQDPLEVRYLAKNGNVKWIKWNKVLKVNDNTVYGIGRDITETKRFESEIEDNRNKLYEIIELVPHPIFLKDSQGRYILVNKAQAELFCTTIHNLLGKDDSYFIKDDNELRGIQESDIKVTLLKEIVTLPEQNITHLDGTNRILHTTKVPFISNFDKEVNILGVSIDLTEVKNAEQELRKINFELDSFVYRASHDLRAPLCSITGLLNLIKKEKDPMIINECIEQAKSSVKRLDSFIADLTNFSRNNRLRIISSKINFTDIVNECLESLKFMDNADQIKIELSTEEHYEFYNDENRLKIIFMNLISNAIKYHSLEQPYPFLRIRIFTSETGAKIEIEDNGSGIEISYHQKIFEMFFRASEKSFGSGLGLYIVKQVIDRLNGSISLKSEVNRGTIFSITLPNQD